MCEWMYYTLDCSSMAKKEKKKIGKGITNTGKLHLNKLQHQNNPRGLALFPATSPSRSKCVCTSENTGGAAAESGNWQHHHHATNYKTKKDSERRGKSQNTSRRLQTCQRNKHLYYYTYIAVVQLNEVPECFFAMMSHNTLNQSGNRSGTGQRNLCVCTFCVWVCVCAVSASFKTDSGICPPSAPIHYWTKALWRTGKWNCVFLSLHNPTLPTHTASVRNYT